MLGVQVTRDIQARSIVVTQEDYTKGLLEKCGVQACRPLWKPGHGKELSLMQPQDSILDEKEKRRVQTIVSRTMYRRHATSRMR